ncbi:hypothetical protein Syun_022772 [Stephania yunnanensis]|uniref:Uncharacterized protein n=1 Tax=Stephania yunnanensis TaxID=152371 RepID=A0AAP0F7M7_9MAGN
MRVNTKYTKIHLALKPSLCYSSAALHSVKHKNDEYDTYTTFHNIQSNISQYTKQSNS